MKKISLLIVFVLISLYSCSLFEAVSISKVSVYVNKSRSLKASDISSMVLTIKAHDIGSRTYTTTKNRFEISIPQGSDRLFSLLVTFSNGMTLSGDSKTDISGSRATVTINLGELKIDGVNLESIGSGDFGIAKSLDTALAGEVSFPLGADIKLEATVDSGVLYYQWLSGSLDTKEIKLENSKSINLKNYNPKVGENTITFRVFYADKVLEESVTFLVDAPEGPVNGMVHNDSIIAGLYGVMAPASTTVNTSYTPNTTGITPGYNTIEWFIDSSPTPSFFGSENFDVKYYLTTAGFYTIKVVCSYDIGVEYDMWDIWVNPKVIDHPSVIFPVESKAFGYPSNPSLAATTPPHSTIEIVDMDVDDAQNIMAVLYRLDNANYFVELYQLSGIGYIMNANFFEVTAVKNPSRILLRDYGYKPAVPGQPPQAVAPALPTSDTHLYILGESIGNNSAALDIINVTDPNNITDPAGALIRVTCKYAGTTLSLPVNLGGSGSTASDLEVSPITGEVIIQASDNIYTGSKISDGSFQYSLKATVNGNSVITNDDGSKFYAAKDGILTDVNSSNNFSFENEAIDMAYHDSHLYIVGGDPSYPSNRGLTVLDTVTGNIVSSIPLWQGSGNVKQFKSIRAVSDYIVVADYTNGVQIFDISDKSTPPRLIESFIDPLKGYHDIVIGSSGIFISDSKNAKVIIVRHYF